MTARESKEIRDACTRFFKRKHVPCYSWHDVIKREAARAKQDKKHTKE